METPLMRRPLLTLAVMAAFGLIASAGTAEACHKKKARCAPACEPVPVCAPAPVCEPEPVCAPEPACAPKKKHGLFARKGGCGHMLKKRGCCKPEPACATDMGYYAPVVTATYAPVYAAPQTYAAPQGYAAPQSPAKAMPQVPSKQG
jgi:hypothetical protein